MIISSTDHFLFQKMGIMLLASGKNKTQLMSSISTIQKCLNNAKPFEQEPNYVRVMTTPELNSNIHAAFDSIFIGCNVMWKNINAEVKFSVISSTLWNMCFNSLWKLSIAAMNENARESSGIRREDLPIAVQEHEDLPLEALGHSILKCLKAEMATKSEQETEEPPRNDDDEMQSLMNAGDACKMAKQGTAHLRALLEKYESNVRELYMRLSAQNNSQQLANPS